MELRYRTKRTKAGLQITTKQSRNPRDELRGSENTLPLEKPTTHESKAGGNHETTINPQSRDAAFQQKPDTRMPNMKMIRTTISTLAMTYFLLACGQTPTSNNQSATEQKILGTAELMVGDGIRPSDLPTISPKGAINESSVQFSRLVSSGAIDSATERYVWATYEFKNITTGNLTNLSLYAYNDSANNAAGTAFKAVRRLDNTAITDTNVIRGIQPSAGLILNTGVFNVNPAEANFQVFRSSEASAVDAGAKVLGSLLPNDSILEYGFTIRSASGDRTLIPNELGVVTLGFRVPLQTIVTNTPRRFTTMFTYATDAITRVTRDKFETTAQVVARAAAPVSATEVAMFGSDTDTAPNPLKTVRLLQIKTFVDPASSPVTVGSSGGIVSLGLAKLEIPSGAVPANTSFAIERLNALPASLPTSEEMGRIGDARLVSGYRLLSSINKFQDYIKFTVPIDIPATIPGDQLTTELYVWDGLKYDKVRIGSDDRSFEYTNYQMLGSKSGSLTNVTDFLVIRAPSSSVSQACTAGGGTWNGIYCQGGVGALSLRENRNTTVNQKVLSINVGNTDLGYCGLYLVKLCGYADEQKIGRYIASQNADIIALQETWHNQCFFVDIGDRDRLCSRTTVPLPGFGKQMERLLLTNQGYDTRCSPTVSFPNEPANSKFKIVNGYECIAIRNTLFEFVTAVGSSPATIQPPCQTTASGTYFLGSDTGSQVETIRPKTFVYRDPITAPDLTLARQAVEFDVVNSHLATSLPISAICTDLQITAISQRYFDLRPNLIRPLGKRLLLLGDYNRGYGNQNEAPFQTFAPFQSALNLATIEPPNATDPRRRIAYLLSNPNEFTASYLGVSYAGFDHAASNFLELAGLGCVRGNRTANMDHNPTFCTLKGIDACWTRGLIAYNQTNPDGTITTQVPELNFMSARKYGVELTYVKTRQYVNTSGLHTVIGLSDAGPVILEFRRCKVTGPVNFESQFEVGSGGSVSFGPKIYPSVSVCI